MLDRVVHRKQVLDNGLRVVTVELPHLHTCTVVMYARVGSRYESRADNGLSHFLEHMLFRGTEPHPDAFQLNHAIESLGGTLYAETGRDYSLYQLSLPPESLDDGIALLGEIFRAPVFDDLETERRIVLEEILEDLDEDGRVIAVDDLARELAFPGHALGQPITGPYENVERFTLADVRRHFRRCYGARNMVFAVTGAIDSQAVHARARAELSSLPPGEELSLVAPPDDQRAPRFRYVENQGPQTSVQLLFRAVPELDPRFVPLQLLSRVLDDGMSTRLHRRVCDELGLAYYVSASIESFVDCGLYEIDANCAHANVAPLVRESLGLIAHLRDEPPPAAELDKARRRYRYDLQASLDDPDAMAGWWGGTELFFAPLSFEEKLARMEAVTPADLSAVAREVFRPERLSVVAVGLLEAGLEAELRRVVEQFR